MTPPDDREFDLILWGASGFTGQLVAAHLRERYGATPLRWALAGRDEAKLAALRERLAAPSLPLLRGDAHDARAMEALARRTRVVCTTVGPYARHGSALVAACASLGTHYCDLAGEVPWIRRMHDLHQHAAERSGARLVTCCGFDSIPSDLGVFALQRAARARYGAPSTRIEGALARASGGVSGGTAASMLALFEASAADEGVRRVLRDPYALNPSGQRHGPPVPDRFAPHHHRDFDQWTAPFVMAAVNTRVVRRSAALLAPAHGRGLRYRESLLTGRGALGAARAAAISAGLALALTAVAAPPLRRLVASRLPQPGEGPSAERRARGHWEMRFVAAPPAGSGGAPLRARLRGDGDPGYASTARMLAEGAACLALDPLQASGGFHTPASAMGAELLERLQHGARVGVEVG